MNDKMLVTYASRSGSTAEVAQAIGQTLSASGAHVDVLPMQAIADLSPYRAVVAGSAIRGARWLPEAVSFVQTQRAALAQRPFAMFTVCITLAMSNSDTYRSAVSGWVAPVRALVQPLSEAFFQGLLDFSKLPLNLETLKLHATVALGIFPKDDRRDWNAIRAWAMELKPILAA